MRCGQFYLFCLEGLTIFRCIQLGWLWKERLASSVGNECRELLPQPVVFLISSQDFFLHCLDAKWKKAFLVDEVRLPQPSRYAKALNKEVRYYWESKMCYPKEEITNSTINTASSEWHIFKIEVTDSPDDFYYVWGMNKWSLTSRCWPILCMSPAHTFRQPLLKSQHTWCKHLKPTRIKSADLMAGHEPLIAEGGHILFNVWGSLLLHGALQKLSWLYKNKSSNKCVIGSVWIPLSTELGLSDQLVETMMIMVMVILSLVKMEVMVMVKIPV